jgi:uracil-DNA glycosylase family protein
VATRRIRSESILELPFAKQPVNPVPRGALQTLRAQAASCRACPLWRNATQTVFGHGAATATAMLIGEQPGDEEDRAGRPFVGAAGRVLDKALAEAELDQNTLYLTNTVKHFKYEQRGKRRMHERANAHEQEACRIWIAAEWQRLRPRLALALGAMAAQTLFGNSFRLTRERGRWIKLDDRSRAMATWHPSAILRTTGDARAQRYAELVDDLRSLGKALDALD